MAWWSFNAHDPHEPTDSATSNAMAQFLEFISQLALPKKGTFHVNFVDEADKFSVAPSHFTGCLFETISIHLEQLVLTPN
jgi:hypothetical protein